MRTTAGVLSVFLGLGSGIPGALGTVHLARTGLTGSVHAAALGGALLPPELVFWIGFTLPLRPILGLERTVLFSWREPESMTPCCRVRTIRP